MEAVLCACILYSFPHHFVGFVDKLVGFVDRFVELVDRCVGLVDRVVALVDRFVWFVDRLWVVLPSHVKAALALVALLRGYGGELGMELLPRVEVAHTAKFFHSLLLGSRERTQRMG